MTTVQCAICEKKQKIKELYPANFSVQNINAQTFSARRTPDRMHYRFVRCGTCGLIFSNPILSQKKIATLYRDSTFEYTTESSYLQKTYGLYLKKIIPKTKKARNALSLLDIGCGNGFFLDEAKKMGITQVYGVEPGKASVKNAPRWLQKRITIGLFKKNLFTQNTFDVICCFHTLDHLVDPNAFLQAVYQSLKKGGKVLFIVHDTDGLSVKLFGEKSPIFDIEHIYLFNKNTLSQLFAKHRFRVLETFPVKNTYPLSYWMRMSPFPKPIKKIMLWILNTINADTIPLSVSAGNIGIVAEK